jgi:pimeloyl-ACP methyl ester carboxylesterase
MALRSSVSRELDDSKCAGSRTFLPTLSPHLSFVRSTEVRLPFLSGPRNEGPYYSFNLRCNISLGFQDIVHALPSAPMTKTHRKDGTFPSFLDQSRQFAREHPYLAGTVAAVVASAISALINRHLARKAEQDNPPVGQFLDIDGVRLHYLEQGSGEPLVLLHGNGSMIADFQSSGLIDLAAKSHRVIIFDRPGFGHSNRPRNVVWTPNAQAELLYNALQRLGISQSVILGHSWGASVAVALALKYPTLVRGLVLASGYYYPTPRVDVIALSAPAIPLVGDVISHTLSPIVSRVMWPIMLEKIFGPQSVPPKFDGFPREMAVRPSQIHASAAESALMIPDALGFHNEYSKLKMPVSIIAGEDDKLIDIDRQSSQLHDDITHSRFHRIPGNGHMVHQTATSAVMSAIDEVVRAASSVDFSSNQESTKAGPVLIGVGSRSRSAS